MNLYIDTNVILAYFNNKDPMYKQSQNILNEKTLIFFTGFITVLEFESVIGRMWINHQIHFEPEIEKKISDLSEANQIKAITEICFNKLIITILPLSALEKRSFNNIEYLIENTITFALNICPSIHLRSLDIIHLASALKIKNLSKNDIEFFLTNDQTILNNAQEIRNKLHFIPISCIELLSILKNSS